MNAHAEFVQLVSESFQRSLDAAGTQRLRDLLRDHPEFQDDYLEQVQLHSALEWWSGRAALGAAVVLENQTVSPNKTPHIVTSVSPASSGLPRVIRPPAAGFMHHPHVVAPVRRRFSPVQFWMGLAASLALCVGGGWLAYRQMSHPMIGTLAQVSGNVSIQSGNSSAQATERAEIRSGAILVSEGRQSLTTLRYTDGSVITLSGDTRMEVKETASGQEVRLAQGMLNAAISKQASKTPFVFYTPYGFVTVVGTKFTLEVGGRMARLVMSEGLVGVQQKEGEQATPVEAGQQAVMTKEKPIRVERSTPTVQEEYPILLSLDFEDGRLPAESMGTIVAGPALPGSRYCVAGQDLPNHQCIRVMLRNQQKGLFTYREGAVLTFDYWVDGWGDGNTPSIDVFMWDRTQQASMGQNVTILSKTGAWIHSSIRLADLHAVTGQQLREADVVKDLCIQTSRGGKALYIDNVAVTLQQTK